MPVTPNPPIQTVGAYVRYLRIRHGDDLTELAGRLGVSKALISSVEHGRRNLGEENAEALAALYTLADDERDTLLRLRDQHRDANSTRTVAAAQNLDARIAALETEVKKLDALRAESVRLARANRDLVAAVRKLAELSGVDPKLVLPASRGSRSVAL